MENENISTKYCLIYKELENYCYSLFNIKKDKMPLNINLQVFAFRKNKTIKTKIVKILENGLLQDDKDKYYLIEQLIGRSDVLNLVKILENL